MFKATFYLVFAPLTFVAPEFCQFCYFGNSGAHYLAIKKQKSVCLGCLGDFSYGILNPFKCRDFH